MQTHEIKKKYLRIGYFILLWVIIVFDDVLIKNIVENSSLLKYYPASLGE